MLNGKKMEGMICDMTGKEVKKMFMCPCRVKLTEKFVCDKDCIYCGKEEAEIKTESVKKS